MTFSRIDNVSVNMGLLAPSHPSLCDCTKQPGFQGNRLSELLTSISLTAPGEFILQPRRARRKQECSLTKAEHPPKSSAFTCQLVNEQAAATGTW